MSSTTRGALITAAVLAGMVAFEVFGLRAGAVGVVLIGAVCVLSVAIFVVRIDLRFAGVLAACGAAFTLSWNGVRFGLIQPGDVLVLLALVLLVAARPNSALRTPPWWIKQLAFAIVIVVIAQIYFPPSLQFLQGRSVITARGEPTVSTTKNLVLVNLGVGFKFLVAIAAVPIVFAAAVRARRAALRWLGISFATGTALSGTIALSDRYATNIASLFTGIPNGGGRQFGLSDHPNFLGPALVMAFPFAYWLIFGEVRRDRWIGLACLPGLVGGVYVTGSRGGAVAMVIVILVCVGLHPRTRVYLGNIFGTLLAGGAIIILAFPDIGHTILTTTRLDVPYTTSGSDQVRSILGAQGVRDFLYRPFAGVGLQVSDEASQVYLQQLASGGLILFVAMTVYMLGALFSATHLLNREPVAGAVLAALIATLALNFVQANLTDRYYYVPAAVLVALLERRRLEAEDTAPVPVRAAVQ